MSIVAAAPASISLAAVPQRLPAHESGSHRITARVGAGGMGEVYGATEGWPPTPQCMARFEREVQMPAALHHPQHRQRLRHRAEQPPLGTAKGD
jgi:hypothetical protein